MRLQVRTIAVIGAVVATLAGVSACGGPDEGSPTPLARGVAEIAVDGPDCLADEVLAALPYQPADEQGSRTATRPAPAAGTVPPGFEPTQVVLCRVPELTLVEPGQAQSEAPPQPSSGQASSGASTSGGASVEQVVLIGDLGPLLAALDRPSDPVPTDLACPPMFEYQPQLYLVDAQGRAVRPRWPVDACGFLHDGATAALADLTEVSSTLV